MMYSFKILIVTLCYCAALSKSLPNANEPLFLSPLIKKGEIEKAKSLSRVGQNICPKCRVKYSSHSGFITIDEKLDANIFFWFFKAKNGSKDAPVLMWFNGGPGYSSMYGLFGEIGPYNLDKHIHTIDRRTTWVTNYNVIFADIPLQAGYSFVKNNEGLAKTSTEAGEQVHKFLIQFFRMFPEFRDNDFYVCGESYGAKAVVASAKIISENSKGPDKINMKGIITVSGFVDPPTMLKPFADQMYSVGLVNEKQKQDLSSRLQTMFQLLQENKTLEAVDIIDRAIVGFSEPSYFQNVTGMTDYSDLTVTNIPAVFLNFFKFIDQSDVRRELHVGNASLNSPAQVASAFRSELLDSYKEDLETILNRGYKVLMITGHLDLIECPPGQRHFVRSLRWKGANEYTEANRTIWRVNKGDSEVAGYVTVAKNLVEILIRNAGHMTPYNQPRACLAAVDNFIHDRNFETS